MTPDRWSAVKKVLQSALERPASERSDFLAEACAADTALRAEVETLLEAHVDAGEFLEHSPSAPASRIGTTVGSYRILEKLGAGGMGEVYLALDTRLSRRVALKFLSSQFTSDPERVRRFRQEAHAASSLNHPNILTIHELGEHQGIQFIASELVEGETLRDRLERGPMELSEIVPVASQVASALRTAHAAGVVHRDIKPENIMLRPDGYVKVLDFGLAKLSEASAPPAHETTSLRTATGVVMGTTHYMSPEQVRGQLVDARTDQWSLGVVLYEMLSSRLPFDGATSSDVIAAILEKEPPNLDVPEELRRITTKTLRKKKEERYATTDDVFAALSAYQKQPGADGPRWRHKSLAAGLAIALVAVATILVLTRRGIRPDLPSKTSAGRETRVVVLPFENLTRRPDDDWLATAFAESLTFRLREVNDLIVIDRDRTAEVYRGQSVQEGSAVDPTVLRDVATTLNARYYVHGTYQKLGDRIKVSARLVDGDSGETRTQESVTDSFSNIFTLQDDLAGRVAMNLEGTRPATAAYVTPSLDAYQAFIEGRTLYALHRFSDAIERMDHAIKLDAGYAQAWAWRAKSYARMTAPATFAGGSVNALRREALDSAEKAAALDPSLYDAHTALALAHRENENIEPWRAAASKAIELNPRLAEAYELLADSYAEQSAWGCARDRQPARAEENFRRAIEIDPRHVVAIANLSGHYVYSAHPQKGVDLIDRALISFPDNRTLRRARAWALVSLGRASEAEQAVNDLGMSTPLSVYEEVILGAADLKRGRSEKAAAHFERALTLLPIANVQMTVGGLYLDANDFRRGLDHIERALQLEPACAAYLSRTPIVARYRTDPRFAAQLAKYRARQR